MDTNEIEQKLSEKYRIVCLIVSQFLMGVLVMGTLPSFGVLHHSNNSTYNSAFFLIGIIIFALAFTVKRLMFRPALGADALASFKRISSNFTAASIVTFAMFESIAVLGLASYVISGDLNLSYIMTAMAVLGMFVNWPKKNEIRNNLKR